jgi:type I restriction enzyme M protein
MQLLKARGRAALVLPDGFLFGEGIKTRIKEKLLQDCNLHTIVRLPNSVFAPYASIKTNLLFFTKGTPTQDIWYYEQTLPAGVKAYNKTKPMKVAEFEALAQWWGSEAEHFKTRQASPHAWKVSLADIQARGYNLDCKNPHITEHAEQDPATLITQYHAMQQDIAQLRRQLQSILSQALSKAA